MSFIQILLNKFLVIFIFTKYAMLEENNSQLLLYVTNDGIHIEIYPTIRMFTTISDPLD